MIDPNDPFDFKRMNADSAARQAEVEARIYANQQRVAQENRDMQARVQADLRDYTQRTTIGFQGGGQVYSQPTYQPDYREAGGRAAEGTRTVKDGIITAIIGPLLVRTYTNWNERTGDKALAFKKMLLVGWMWKMWLFCCFVWFFQMMAGGYWHQEIGRNGHTDELVMNAMYRNVVWLTLPALFFVYMRLSEMSLLERKGLYRFLSAVDAPFRWIPFPVLLTSVTAPSVYFIIASCANGSLTLSY